MRFALGLSVAFSVFSAAAALAENEACHIETAQLICGSGNGLAALEGLAHPQTLEVLQRARVEKTAYSDGYKREDFRKSLEANRKAAKRFADNAFRKARRKRISKEDYAVIRGKFEKAMTAYALGMDTYRDGTWSSEVKPYQAD